MKRVWKCKIETKREGWGGKKRERGWERERESETEWEKEKENERGGGREGGKNEGGEGIVNKCW